MTTTSIPVTTGVVTAATVAGGYGYLELTKDGGPTKLGVSLTPEEALTVGQALVAVAVELLGPGAMLERVLEAMRPMVDELKAEHPPANPDDDILNP